MKSEMIMSMNSLKPSEAVAQAVSSFEAGWAALCASEDPTVWDAACAAWDRLQAVPCQNAADVIAKAAAFATYRSDVAGSNWDSDTLADADYQHLARLFADAAKFAFKPAL